MCILKRGNCVTILSPIQVLDSFLYNAMLLRSEHFFFACGASKRLYVAKGYAVNFKVKLNFNIFNAAGWAKQGICFYAVCVIG